MRNAPYQKSRGRQQSYSNTINAGNYTIEFTLQPLETEWSVPNLMHHGFRVTPEFNDVGDVELYLTIPKRIPSVNIISAQFENDLQTFSFYTFRGEELLRSKEPIVLTEVEPEVNGNIYTEASILKKSYMHKYKFQAILKSRPKARQKPPTQQRQPVSSPETKPVPTTSGNLDEALQRIKKLETTAEQVLESISELNDKFDDRRGLIPISEQQPPSEVSVSAEADFDKFVHSLDHQFTDQASHILEEAAKIVPEELANNQTFQSFQKLHQAVAANNPNVQTLKQANSCFRLPILKFSAAVEESLKKVKGPQKEPEFQSVEIQTFEDYYHSEYITYLCQWLNKETEPPLEAFNPELAYRRYIFLKFQNRLRELKKESSTVQFSEETLTKELDDMKKQSLIQHIAEIETLEKKHLAEIPTLPSIVDQYVTGILNALDMKLIPVKQGDIFDPKVHETQNSTIPAGSMVQKVIHRGIRMNDGTILRRAKVVA